MSRAEAAQLVRAIFVEGRVSTTPLVRHTLDCFAWMIATDVLQLRIAVPTPDSNYHPKLWLFDDGEYQMLARGSGNATGHGVATGVEHLDVDVTWLPESASRVKSGISILDEWSKGISPGIQEVFNLPEALARDIVRTAPKSPPQPNDYFALARMRPPASSRLRIPSGLEWASGQYAHQADAVRMWEGGDAPEKGVVAMATGAGKTLTALICATRVQDRLDGRPLLVIVSAPTIPLVMQWTEAVKQFGVIPITPSRSSSKSDALTQLFRGVRSGGTHVGIITNDLLCSRKFQNTAVNKLRHKGAQIPNMLIADEAHTLGAASFVSNKPELFQRRLALSATPERQYDPDGTEEIFEFFGPVVYEFGLDRAIGFCLVPYRYYVHACTLSGAELDEFNRLSRRIGAAVGSGVSEEESALQSLLIRRRRIIETADTKMELLRRVLVARQPKALEQSLIYASAKNPSQFTRIGELLTELGIKWAPVTKDTTRSPRRLQRIFDSFSQGATQVLLAKKVLDEGIDIPSVREAFIIASSTVEREWVQRRGRILRVHPGKPWGIVHDFLALPPGHVVRRDRTRPLYRLIRNELDRAYAFAKHAQNTAGPHGAAADLRRLSETYWPKAMSSTGTLENSPEYAIASATPKGRLW